MANKVLDTLSTATGELMTDDYTDRWYKVEKKYSLTASFALVSPEKTKLLETTIRCGSILEQSVTVSSTQAELINAVSTTVDTPALIRVGQYMRNIRSGEIAIVTAVDTGTGVVTITRGTEPTTGGAAAAIVSGDVWQLGPLPMAEGWTTLPASKILIPETTTNVIQRFVEPIKITGTELRLMKNGSAKHKFMFNDVIAQAKRNLRLQMADSVVNGKQGTTGPTTGGLAEFAATVDDGSTTFDMTDRKVFEPWIEEQASYCRSDKLMLPCGWEMWQSLHQLYQFSSMSNQNEVLTKIGARLKVIVSISGVDVIPYRERMLPSYLDAAGNTRGQAMTWDPNEVTWVPLSEIGIWDFAKNTGDNTQTYWMAEGGWRIKNAKCIRYTKGILPVA